MKKKKKKKKKKPVRAPTAATESLEKDHRAPPQPPPITGGWSGALDRLQKAGIDVEDIPGMEWHGDIGGCRPATATSEKHGHEPARLTSTLSCFVTFC